MNSPVTEPVLVSVVVPSYNAAGSIQRCIESLVAQDGEFGFEVIVVDSSSDNTPELIEAISSNHVRLIRHSDRLFPGDARNRGVEASSGRIIAFTDADCIVSPTWLSDVVAAFQRYPDASVIGGAVGNANPNERLSWASLFCDLGEWTPQADVDSMSSMPTCNLAMRREAFDQCGPFLEGTFSSDTAFFWVVRQANLLTVFDPTVRIRHINISQPLPFLRKQYLRGRHYGAVRVGCFSPLRRFTYLLGSPLLPGYLFARKFFCAARKRIYFRRYLTSSGWIMAGLVCWSCGESLSYLMGDQHG